MVERDSVRMSDYERKAWQALVDQAQVRSGQQGRFGGWTQNAKLRAKAATTKAREAVERVPRGDQALEMADAAMAKAMQALHTALVERGLNSVKPAAMSRPGESGD